MAQIQDWRRSIVGVLARLLPGIVSADVPGISSANPSRAAGMALSAAQSRLDHLLGLPEPTGQFQTSNATEVKDLLSRGIHQAETATSYCSAIVMKDFLLAHLKDKGYVFRFARRDFAGPDRYHVLKHDSGRNGEDWDSWVTIGDENYQSVGLWFRTEDRFNVETNRKLSLGAAVTQLARMKTPTSSEFLSYGQHSDRYLLVTYGDLARRNDFADLNICGPLVNGTSDFHVWLDANTGAIAKTQLRFRRTAADAEPIDGEIDGVIEQAFACYGETIHVERPPWLNAVPAEKDGDLTITNTKIPKVPFH